MIDSPRQSVLYGTALIFSGRMLNRFLGLGREVLSAALFGSGRAMDSFNLAFTVVTSLRQSFAEQFLTPIVPTYFQRRKEGGEETALRSLNAVVTRLNLFALIVSLLLLVFGRKIVILIAPGFDAQQINLSTILVRWFAIGAIAFILHRLYSGLHMCFFRYYVVSFSPLLMNVVVIGAMLLFARKYSVISLAAGFSLGYLAYFLMQAMLLPNRRALLTPHWRKGDTGALGYAQMLFPLFIAVGFEQAQLYIDRALATGLPPGTLSAQGYALRIIRTSSEMWLASFGTVVFPVFSSLAASDKLEEFSRNFSLAIQAAMLFLFYSGTTIISQAIPLVRILLERGAFERQDTILTAHLLNFYAVAYIAQAVWIIILRGFYAFGNTKTPVYATMFSMAVTILLDFLLVGPMGISGLALALAIGYSLNMVLAYVLFMKHIRKHDTLETIKSILIGLAISCIIGFSIHECWAFFVARQLFTGFLPSLVAFLLLSGAAALAYFVALRAVRAPALEYVLNKIKQRRKKV
ncbi:MAG TPA: lipid II flippase MurJ [bacterium]|jgi:putative peptidoglycan lipid II flippase